MTRHVLQSWSVHMRPQWAYDRGLLVHSGLRPEDVPLTLPDGRVVALLGTGAYWEVTA